MHEQDVSNTAQNKLYSRRNALWQTAIRQRCNKYCILFGQNVDGMYASVCAFARTRESLLTVLWLKNSYDIK